MMQQAKGFTLIELIAVMLITVILLYFIGIKTPTPATYSFSSVVERLKRDIRYTQTLAMSLNTSYSLATTASGYLISPNPPAGAYSVTMPSGVTLSAATITFDTSGAPAAAVSITITATGIISKSITVTAETGFISG